MYVSTHRIRSLLTDRALLAAAVSHIMADRPEGSGRSTGTASPAPLSGRASPISPVLSDSGGGGAGLGGLLSAVEVADLYATFSLGQRVGDIVWRLINAGVDPRRFIVFGVINGLLRRLHEFPVVGAPSPDAISAHFEISSRRARFVKRFHGNVRKGGGDEMR